MRTAAYERDDPVTWDVASPGDPGRIAGVSMAGFGVPRAAALRMIPHPSVMLCVEFGAGKTFVDISGGRRRYDSLVAGSGFGYGGEVRVRGVDVVCVQVRLSPVAARAILGVSPAELDGSVVELEDLWGRKASLLRERLNAASSWQQRFALTGAFLTHRRESTAAVDREVAWAWHRIVTSRGLARVDLLAAELGWSRKRLWSRFRSQLGLPPKRAATLVRFDAAAHRLVAGEDAARAAAASGYTDQSHLHRDVQAFCGVTPGAVAVEPFLTVDDVAWPATTHVPRTVLAPRC